MNPRINELVERIRRLEDEIEQELQRRREELNADSSTGASASSRTLLEQQRRFRTGLLKYILGARLR